MKISVINEKNLEQPKKVIEATRALISWCARTLELDPLYPYANHMKELVFYQSKFIEAVHYSRVQIA
jgi:hypothetical protein